MGVKLITWMVLGAVAIVAAGVIAVLGLALAHRRPPKVLPLRVAGRGNASKWPAQLRLMTWNLGYAGMGAEADFFLDGGRSVLARDKPTVLAHVANFIHVLQQHPQDVYLLQEVDAPSRRSYYVPEVGLIAGALSGHYRSSALNFNVWFLPYPFTQPIGRVRSGLLSLGKYRPAEAARYQLPGSFRWPVSAFHLERCALLWRLPREDGKEWVVINIHLEAWDAGGNLRRLELAFLRDLAVAEYRRGSYVIVGGDWNATLPGVRPDRFPSERKADRYAVTVPPDFLPSGWSWGVDASCPSNRSAEAPYRPGGNYLTVIDGFLVSPNVQVVSVETLPLGFRDSDHEPVMLRVLSR
jgi:endonuclease/exonuclease/phosphatase family metal-dependent hydrolase